MSDPFYTLVVTIGRLPFFASSRPTVLHRDRVPRAGAFLLAANHLSPYDVPVLLRHTPRHLDFVSIIEVFRKPLVGRFFAGMNAFPMDRRRVDTRGTRTIVDRLQAGRCVAIFPEGHIRATEHSILTGAPLRPTLLRVARMAGVPVLPAVVLNTTAYRHWKNWLPRARVHYGVIYGHPFAPAAEHGEAELSEIYRQLYAKLRAAMESRHADRRA